MTRHCGGRRKGRISRRHDHFFHTLEPGQTVNFTARFILSMRPDNPLTAGHRYRFGVGGHPLIEVFEESQQFERWLLGTREEALSKPGEDEFEIDWAHESIEVIMPKPIEFDVLGSQDPGVSEREGTLST